MLIITLAWYIDEKFHTGLIDSRTSCSQNNDEKGHSKTKAPALAMPYGG
jgi:hypothetical protein